MFTPILMTALALSVAPPQSADTTFAVPKGARLDVENHRGEVVVQAWKQDAVRVSADVDRVLDLDITRTGSVIRVRPQPGIRGIQDVEMRINVPEWMAVRIQGNQVDVGVEGTAAEIGVETVNGDVAVTGGEDRITLHTIQGEIRLRNARGRIEVVSVNEDIRLEDVQGDITAETTNGDITIRGARSGNARATTVNGEILYDGDIRNNGRYAFSTHNGDVVVTVPESTNATVSVSTYQGDFESDFPVQLTGATQDRQFQFTLGDGSARLDLESFNGEIHLQRPR